MTSFEQILTHPKSQKVNSKDTKDIFTQWLPLIKEYLRENFSDTEYLKNQTFISPKKLHQLTHNSQHFFDRHKHFYSWRSFWKWFMHEWKQFAINFKWSHLLERWNIRGANKDWLFAKPAFWCETANALSDEFDKAMHLQETSLQYHNKIWPFPIPIKVSIPQEYIYKWNIWDYKKFVEYIFATCPNHKDNLFYNCKGINPDIVEEYPTKKNILLIKELYTNPELIHSFYRDKVGEHWSYIYLIQNTNMRIADVFKLPTREEMQAVIRSYYPNQSDIEICQTFMQNFWEAYGTLLWSWLQYRPIEWKDSISACFPVDTTIMWHAVDIEWYKHAANNEIFGKWLDMMQKHQWVYAETCFLFYAIFFPASYTEFKKTYMEYFTQTYAYYFLQTLHSSNTKYEIEPKDLSHTINCVSRLFWNKWLDFLKNYIIKNNTPLSNQKYLWWFFEKIRLLD
jgi:hypothetical protein